MPLYAKFSPVNVFGVEPNYGEGALMIFLLGVQILGLYAQQRFGPRKIFPARVRRWLWNDILEYDLTDEELKVRHLLLQGECSICYDSLSSVTPFAVKTSCKHTFHQECLQMWLLRRQVCPLCLRPCPFLVLKGLNS